MLTKEEARIIALAIISQLAKDAGQDYVILEEAIVERPFAWAFPFNTKEYAETGDIQDMVVGLGPVVVNRRTGAAELAPSSGTIARFLDEYEAALKEDQ